jgi:hypothetical protein
MRPDLVTSPARFLLSECTFDEGWRGNTSNSISGTLNVRPAFNAHGTYCCTPKILAVEATECTLRNSLASWCVHRSDEAPL